MFRRGRMASLLSRVASGSDSSPCRESGSGSSGQLGRRAACWKPSRRETNLRPRAVVKRDPPEQAQHILPRRGAGEASGQFGVWSPGCGGKQRQHFSGRRDLESVFVSGDPGEGASLERFCPRQAPGSRLPAGAPSRRQPGPVPVQGWLGELKAGLGREVVLREMFAGDSNTAGAEGAVWQLELAAKLLPCLLWLTSETSGCS